MRSIRMLGLAAMAALATMAMSDASSAMAEDTEVVLCKQLLKLCRTEGGTVLPAGTEFLAFTETKRPVWLGALKEECNESQFHGKITSAGGMGTSLLGELTSLSFTGNCTPCTTFKPSGLPYTTHLRVNSEDKYILETLAVLLEMSGCPLGVTCNFKTSALTVDVQDNGGEFPLIESLEAPFEFDSGTGGKTFCGATMKWDANYSVKCEEKQGAGEFPCWPSLELLEP